MNSSEQIEVELTGAQYDFLTSENKFEAFIGGIGSGKSFAGAHWSRNKIATEPQTMGFIGANTYKQLNNATLNTFFQVLDEFKIPYQYKENKGKILINGREQIITQSLENYETMRGFEIGWFWIDETRDTREKAFDVLLGRLRHRGAKALQGRVTTSPFGFNWLYDRFVGDRKSSDTGFVKSTSMENPYLPDGYIDSLRQQYDEKVFQQEVLAEFLDITTGRIYYAFDREQHVKPCIYSNQYPVWVGMDFNVNPMTAVVCQTIGNTTYVIDEIWVMSSNTNEVAEMIVQKYGRGVSVVPDSTGKALKTSSGGVSDHQILRDNGLTVIYNRNPFRVDRYNCINGLLEKGRLIVDPKCVKLIRDLEQVTYKDGTSFPDTNKNKELTHISDGLGYYCYYAFPILKPYGNTTFIDR